MSIGENRECKLKSNGALPCLEQTANRYVCGDLRNRFSSATLRGLLAIIISLAGFPFLQGCTTKAKAREQAQAAFMAGQQAAMARMSQPQKPIVTFIGQVRTPTIPWSQGLTLAQGIVSAGYFGKDPKQIMIVRNGQAVPVDPKQLLNGEDVPLESGDLVQINQ